MLNDYRLRAGGRAVTAPFDIVFGEHDVVQPDVVFFRAERLHLLDPDLVTRAAPDIAVEVLSPSTVAIDRGRKRDLFARHGIPEYWIADPIARRVEVNALEQGAYRCAQIATPGDTVRSVLFPDLTFAAGRLFASP